MLIHPTVECLRALGLAAAARSVLMSLGLHEFADFANYQLPEIG